MKKPIAYIMLFALIVGCLFSCSTSGKQGDLTVLFMDTGKSDSILIRTESTVILVDAGYAKNENLIVNTLNREGVDKIDYMILTHYDQDHIGAAPGVLKRFEVAQVYLPDYTAQTQEYRLLEQAISETAVAVNRVTADVVLNLVEGATVKINPTHLTGITNDNDHSLITSLRWNDFGILFLADALKNRIEEYMALDTNQYQVVKLPHHGNYFKKLETYMNAIHPTEGVICCDQSEREVEDELLSMCADLGIKVYRTDMGAIRLIYDANSATYTITQS